jgi:ABC-type bacteriocin/lantibiotic exporter with double-glycine peptidase domain
LPQALLVPWMQQRINRLARTRTGIVRRLCHAVTAASEAAPAGRGKVLETLIRHIHATRMRIYVRKFLLTFLGNVLDALGPIIVLVVGGYLVIQGRTEVSTLVVFISGFQKLGDPWNELVTFYRTAANAQVAYALVAESLDEPRPADRGR